MVLWQKSHTKSVHPSTATLCRQIVRSATVLAPVQSCSVQLIGLTVTWICFLGHFCSDCTILGGRNYGNSKNLDLMLFTWICFLEFFGWFVFTDWIPWDFFHHHFAPPLGRIFGDTKVSIRIVDFRPSQIFEVMVMWWRAVKCNVARWEGDPRFRWEGGAEGWSFTMAW